MVDDGGDDVRHGETEAALKEKDGVEDVMGLVTVNCGLCQRWDCSLWAGGQPGARVGRYCPGRYRS